MHKGLCGNLQTFTEFHSVPAFVFVWVSYFVFCFREKCRANLMYVFKRQTHQRILILENHIIISDRKFQKKRQQQKSKAGSLCTRAHDEVNIAGSTGKRLSKKFAIFHWYDRVYLFWYVIFWCRSHISHENAMVINFDLNTEAIQREFWLTHPMKYGCKNAVNAHIIMCPIYQENALRYVRDASVNSYSLLVLFPL